MLEVETFVKFSLFISDKDWVNKPEKMGKIKFTYKIWKHQSEGRRWKGEEKGEKESNIDKTKSVCSVYIVDSMT